MQEGVDVVFDLQHSQTPATSFSGLSVYREKLAPLRSPYPLNMEMAPSNARWFLHIEYAAAIFHAHDIGRIVRRFEHYLSDGNFRHDQR